MAYSMVVSFLRDVAVAITPVEGDLLFLFLVQPDELLSRLRHKVKKALQVALPVPRRALKYFKQLDYGLKMEK